nr:RNA polymerase-associated protein RapA [uncultured bacterium]
MAKRTEASETQQEKEKAEKTAKVSYHYKPDNLTLEQWQIALRKQAAMKETFSITEINTKEYPGYYKVKNPVSRNEYSVVYRGDESPWNYCSCMDFKVSRLGTCKHLEAVKLWIDENGKCVCRDIPAYSSVYLSYKGDRKVCLRVGTDNEAEFRKLAAPYFTPDGVMRPEAINHITDFFREATRLNNTFRWYSDALSFILEQREKRQREHFLAEPAAETIIDSLLKTPLYAYQKEGIRFAYHAGKSIIADEMGLGKTIQALGTAELMRRQNMVDSILIICPTSLKYQWKKEIERFTDAKAIVVEGNHLKRKELYKSIDSCYKIVSYNSVCNDIKIMNSLHTDFLIMDEVQRLKNWKTKISQAARRIESEYAVILSGTPLENKLEELYSIMQFVDQYCLGPYYAFMEQTVVKSETGKIVGYKNLNAVGELMKEVLIRRRKKDVALQLPKRMDKILFVSMTKEQQEMHDEFHNTVAQLVYKWTRHRFLSEKDRKRLLLSLSQMRMVCDSTYILDQKTRYDTKIEEVMNILKDVFESGDEKVVIFSQWERMTRLIAAELDKLNIRYENLHGGVPSEKRKVLMENFTELPESRVFLSTDAGSTGLNLQVASVLINMDLPWNPAVLEQRIARIYRIGQKNNIQVINLVASRSIEERMLSTLNFKSSLFEGILDNGEDTIFLEDSKFDKIMESIKETVEAVETTSEGATFFAEEKEAPLEEVEEVERKEEERTQENIQEETTEKERQEEERKRTSGNSLSEEDPDILVQQGVSFLSGLARTLASPEATRKLVDSLVEEDEETGRATLRIQVPDKESVVGVLSMLGKLFKA